MSTACLVTSTGAFGGADCDGQQRGHHLRQARDAAGARSGLRCHRTWPVERLNSSPARGGCAGRRRCTGSCCGVGDPGERERGLAERRGRAARARGARGGACAGVRRGAWPGGAGRALACGWRAPSPRAAATSDGQRRARRAAQPAPAPPPGGERSPAAALAGGQEGRGAHRRGGLRSAPTMPTREQHEDEEREQAGEGEALLRRRR